MLNAIQKEHFEKDWDGFVAEQPEGTLYKTLDENGQWSIVPVHQKLRSFTEAYIEKHNSGFSSKSAFQIVLDLLVNNGDFKAVVDREPEVPDETADFIRRYEANQVSTFEFRRAYMSNRALRDAYDRHTGLAQLAAEADQPLELTAAQYRSMPANVIRQRSQREPRFREAVDRLIKKGAI